MPEQTLWSGTPSQLKNLGWFVLCVLVIPIPIAIYKWLETKCHLFQLTTERLLVTRGILSKTTDTLELYRVRDIQVTQPLWLRLFGLHNVHLITADTSTPCVALNYMPVATGLPDQFRTQVEANKMRKRVREVAIDEPLTMDEPHAS
jgi:uncharacterized membrane protein YdbT with pleckstrin-like domain